MLVYEKKVDGVRHLFGTLENKPSDDDLQLTYTDRVTGDAISDMSVFNFVYNDEDNLLSVGLSRRQLTDMAEDKKLNIWLGDLLLIGEEQPPQPSKKLSVDFVVDKAVYTVKKNGNDVEIPEDGSLVLDISVEDEVEFTVSQKSELGTLSSVDSDYTTDTKTAEPIEFTTVVGETGVFSASITIDEDSDYFIKIDPSYSDL